MKSIIFTLCAIACVYASPVEDAAATVLRSTYEQNPDGQFQYVYETDNGISAQADGKLKPTGNKDEVALEVQGSVQYISPEGEKIQTSYIANEFGFQPQGAHLPTTPAPVPIPDYIARAIAYIAAHPAPPQKF